jgi:hypothetical protein
MVLEVQGILCCEMLSTSVCNWMEVISTVVESAYKMSRGAWAFFCYIHHFPGYEESN